MRRRVPAVWMLCAVMIAAGCRESAPTPATPPDLSVRRETERGPVRLVIEAQPAEVDAGGKVTVTLDVTAADGVVIEMPRLDEEELGSFVVREQTMPPDVPEGATRRWRSTYVLDTFATGVHEIPPFTVAFRDDRAETLEANGEPIVGDLVTEPIAVTIRSVLRSDEEMSSPRPLKDAVAVDVPREIPGWWWVPLLAVVVLAALFVAWRRRSRRPVPPPPLLPPHVIALQALTALRAEELPEQHAFEAFYDRLSAIVRRYLEDRFGLMAPERTTEEFLREARASRDLSDRQRDALGVFLRAADLVKFARVEPTVVESHAALDAAVLFVQETKRVNTPTEPATPVHEEVPA